MKIKLYILAVLICLILPFQSLAQLCIAHRGFSASFRENTIEAIEGALDAGADIVEVDVRRTADDFLILFHDETITEKSINSMSYAEIQRLTPLYHVPSLDEIIQHIPSESRLLLDLKDNNDQFVDLLINFVQSKSENRIFFWYQSRSLDLLKRIQNELDSPVVFYVSSLNRSRFLKRDPNPDRIARMLKKRHISGISAKGRQFVDQQFINSFQEQGLKFLIWTINPSDRIHHYKSIGVDGIITDHPDLLKKVKRTSG